jgi:pilus assembly protein CpaE
VPSIRNLARYLDHLNRYSFPADKAHVIINRYSKKGPIVEQQIEKAIRKNIRLTIPNSYAEVIQAVNTGTPIAPSERSEFAKAMQHWAQAVQGSAAGESGRSGKKAEARKLGILGL